MIMTDSGGYQEREERANIDTVTYGEFRRLEYILCILLKK